MDDLLPVEQTEPVPTEEQARAIKAFDAGVAESNRRERGDFDELLGQFPKKSSDLLKDILSTLRNYLLDRYSDDDAQRLLVNREPRPGFHNVPVVPDDVSLAIDLLNSIRSAARCKGDRFTKLILGQAGVDGMVLQSARKAGGDEAGKKRKLEADKWQNHCIDRARGLLAQGKSRSELASILAPQFDVTPRQVRNVLKKAEVS